MSEKLRANRDQLSKPDPQEYRGGYQPSLHDEGNIAYPSPPKGASAIRVVKESTKASEQPACQEA